MKKQDLLWGLGIAVIVAILAVPVTHRLFVSATTAAPYVMGFVKFAVLATMGELLAIRIVSGQWVRPVALPVRALIWGVLGVVITFVFSFFARGVAAGQIEGALPGTPGGFLFALQTSVFMNLTFGPVLMIAHRLSDTWLDLTVEGGRAATLNGVVSAVDWHSVVEFVLFRTIPFFWIPAHTVTFLLPPVYRVITAAMLSLVLGALLAFSKRRGSARATREA